MKDNLIFIIIVLVVIFVFGCLFAFLLNEKDSPGIPDVDIEHLDFPDFCDTEYEPVCGADGETYPNKCTAMEKHVEIAYEGECENSFSSMVDNRCTLDPNKGECDQEITKYYFDIETKTCKPYLWGGCGIYAFDSLEDCVNGCSSWGK